MGILCIVMVMFGGISSAQNASPEAGKESLTADAIMAKVAANQDRNEALRKEFVYRQHIHILTHKPGGKMMREETADYDVTPMPNGTEKKLSKVTGRYLVKGKYETFEGEPVPAEDSLDGDLIKNFRDDLANDKSKDGLAKDLFPLTSEEQKDYQMELLGRETQDGRSVYHIGFKPKDKDEMTWAGEAYIDAVEFEPVRVFTKLSRRMPFMIRTMLGTDLPGIGFNVVYKRQEDGVWFPSTFGTEFRIRALFFINREVSVSLENSAFEHALVKSKVKAVGPVE
ncbi:MAG: hypothetical protein WA477_03430 [Candidatus Sulfotelmatobacter sp.]